MQVEKAFWLVWLWLERIRQNCTVCDVQKKLIYKDGTDILQVKSSHCYCNVLLRVCFLVVTSVRPKLTRK